MESRTVENKLKKMPFSCDKKGLIKMYLSQMTEKDILSGINAIIIDSRKNHPNYREKIALGKTPKCHNIWGNELKEFVDTYGPANGYFYEER